MLSQTQIKQYWAPRCTGPWATVSLFGTGRVTVRPAIVEAVKALNAVLTNYGYRTRYDDTGAYNCRMTASGTWSLHAYAIAMDINWLSNPYASTLRTDMLRYGDGRMPHRICAIRTNNGKQVWNWGGFWSGNKDAMHYEIVCSPYDISTGINWSTVAGSAPAPTPTPTPVQEDIMATLEDLNNALAASQHQQNVWIRAEIDRQVSEKINAQNEWTRSEIDKAVAGIKSHNTTLRDGLAALVRKLATALGYSI